MDTLANLRAFVDVADTGSFTQAARRIGVAPSVLTKRVDQLEWRIQARLFTRSTRRVTLTEVGERYLPQVRELVRQTQETLDGMQRATGALEGTIRIKIPSTLGQLYLGALLNRFLVDQPRVKLEVVLADRSVNPVEEGFDLAIGARPESYGQVQDHPLCPIRRRLCASADYLARRGPPKTAADLLDHDCLVFATTGTRWELQGSQGIVGVDVAPRLKSYDGIALREAALSGLGIAMLGDYLVAPALRAGQLQEVMPHLRLPDIWLKALVPANRVEVPRIRALLDWLKQQLEPVPWDMLPSH